MGPEELHAFICLKADPRAQVLCGVQGAPGVGGHLGLALRALQQVQRRRAAVVGRRRFASFSFCRLQGWLCVRMAVYLLMGHAQAAGG